MAELFKLGGRVGGDAAIAPEAELEFSDIRYRSAIFRVSNLLDSRERGWVDTLLRIDKAANDTSLVFSLEWKGWKLLFTGDAEERSWKEMNKQKVIEPVHFLKVSHHLSHNGTPNGAILDQLLPLPKPDKKKRYAGVSTCEDAYSGIPHEETRTDLAARATIRSTHELKEGKGWVEFTFKE